MLTFLKAQATHKYATLVLLLLIAFGAFFAMGGLPTLDPTAIDWILDNENSLGPYWENDKYFLIDYDFAQHYLGWDYFRHTPLWQFPLGLNPECGLALSSSIIYTDSLPLASLFFHCFDALLPEHFQFFGAWILGCYCLQAIFGYALARFFCNRRLPCLLMAVFFVLSPIFLWRTQCQASLSNQWLLLMALYNFFRPKFARIGWPILFAIASMLSIYFLPMLGGLLFADLVRRAITNTSSLRDTLLTLIEAPLAAVVMLWAVGAFEVSGLAMCAVNFDLHRINLAAPFDPDFLWSETFLNLPNKFTFYEGFAYLGSGMIVLLWGALILWIVANLTNKRNTLSASHLTKTHTIVLSVCAMIFFFISLSNKVALCETELFEYPLDCFAFLTETFRASGRMFWVANYCLYLGIFALLVRCLKPAALTSLLAAALVFQCWDMQKVFVFFHNINANKSYESPMVNSFWNDAAGRYSKLRVMFPSGNGVNTWKPLAIYADTNRMGINSFYLARWDSAKKDLEDAHLWDILNGKIPFDSDSLFVITHNNPNVWNLAKKRAGENDLVLEVDGFKIIAPGMKNTTATQELLNP